MSFREPLYENWYIHKLIILGEIIFFRNFQRVNFQTLIPTREPNISVVFLS